MRFHALTAFGVIRRQFKVSLYGHPTGFYNERAEVLVTPVYLLSADLLLARVVAGRNKPEDGNKTAFVGNRIILLSSSVNIDMDVVSPNPGTEVRRS